ncbi:hypothetical protein F4859DRAFT_521933 [Xylaria cf. heliscus]|nr:hypothetical protein F4859DRAFT_521933 [Xylaria cf. heliscus]
MTKAPTTTKPPFPTYKELPDMSTEGEPGRIVTVNVGYQARAFQVHLNKLGPLAKLLIETSSNKLSPSILLPNENADAFNVVVNWIYNGPLPRAAKASSYVDDTKSLVPICTNRTASTDLAWGNDLPARSKSEKPESAKQGAPQLKDAHTTQCVLLDLMMMAERYGWEELYNAAIDAYREGEANLERERPSLLHIEVVYRRTSAGSPVRQFLGDYAYSLARVNKDLTWYLQEKWFEKLPEFLEDMLKRVDGKGPFEYPFRRRQEGKDKDGEGSDKNYGKGVLTREAPLDLSATTYHIHGGRMELDCKRSRGGACVVE